MIAHRCVSLSILALGSLFVAACEDRDVRLGREALEQGDYQRSVSLLTMAAERSRTDGEVRMLIAKAYLRQRNFREAVAWLNQAQRLGITGSQAGKIILEEARIDLLKSQQPNLNLFEMASGYDPTLGSAIGPELFDAAEKTLATPNPALMLYHAAIKYDSAIAPRAAKSLLAHAITTMDHDTRGALLKLRSAVQFDKNVAPQAGQTIAKAAHKKLQSDPASSIGLVETALEYDPQLKNSLVAALTTRTIEAVNSDDVIAAKLLSSAVIRYEPSLGPTIATSALKRVQELTPSGDNWERIRDLAALAKELNARESSSWAVLLTNLLNRTMSLPIRAQDRTAIGRLVVNFDAGAGRNLSSTFTKFGTSAISASSPDLDAAAIFFGAAVEFDRSSAESVNSLIWDHFSRFLFASSSVEQNRFLEFWNVASRFTPAAKSHEGIRLYAAALGDYLKGHRAKAMEMFNSIAKGQPNTVEAKASAAILSAPRPSTIKHSIMPFRLNSGSSYLEISLVSSEITSSDIALTFKLRGGPGQYGSSLEFGTLPVSGEYAVCEKLFLIDDLGTKIYASSGFIGGTQKSYECRQRIEIKPNEEILVSARFPMISRGATSVKFVSPKLFGRQSEWFWNNIYLKNGPFGALPANYSIVSIHAPGNPGGASQSPDRSGPKPAQNCFMFNGKQVCN